MQSVTHSVMVGWLLKGDTMDEHRETPSHPHKGQRVRVLTGPFAGFSGTILDIDESVRRVWVVVLFLGREAPMWLDVLQVVAIP
jgi:transcription antitermination factor NusG